MQKNLKIGKKIFVLATLINIAFGLVKESVNLAAGNLKSSNFKPKISGWHRDQLSSTENP